MGSADEVNIQASELNRTMKVLLSAVSHIAAHCFHSAFVSIFKLALNINMIINIKLQGALCIKPLSCFVTDKGFTAAQVINRFLSKFTGMSTDDIEIETDRDNFLGPQAAIEKGVIDRVLQR